MDIDDDLQETPFIGFVDVLAVLMAVFFLVAAVDALERSSSEKTAREATAKKYARLITEGESLEQQLKYMNLRFNEKSTELENLRGRRIIIPNEVEGKVFFNSGSAKIRREFIPLLNNQLVVVREALMSGRFNLVQIVGHTDNDPIQGPPFTDNWELGSARALSVLRYFEAHGVPSSKLSVASRGERVPLVPGSSVGAKRQNRRIELVLLLQ